MHWMIGDFGRLVCSYIACNTMTAVTLTRQNRHQAFCKGAYGGNSANPANSRPSFLSTRFLLRTGHYLSPSVADALPPRTAELGRITADGDRHHSAMELIEADSNYRRVSLDDQI